MESRRIERDSPVPYYRQLADQLTAQIRAGVYKDGDALPPERVLRETYAVSRATVREAVNHLKMANIVETRRGSGNFVKAGHRFDRDLLGVHNFDLQIEQSGHTNRVEVLGYRPDHRSSRVAAVLALNEDEPIIMVTRLRLADEAPLFIETIYLPRRLFPDVDEADFTSTTVFSRTVAQVHGIRIRDVMVALEPVLLTEHEAAVLGVPSLPAAGLLNDRVSHAEDGRPVVYSEWLFAGNRCRHILKLTARERRSDG